MHNHATRNGFAVKPILYGEGGAMVDAPWAESFAQSPPPLDAEVAPPPLLILLDDAVRRSPVACELRGTLCVAVRERWNVAFWTARFMPRPNTTLSRTVPASVDALLGMTSSEASALVGLKPMPDPPFFVVYGDRALLRRFLAEILGGVSPLSARALAIGRK